jgi:hypothetical protein
MAALERCIEIVGEGVRRLPNELKQRRGDIPYKQKVTATKSGEGDGLRRFGGWHLFS